MITVRKADDFDMDAVCDIFNYYVHSSTATFAETAYSKLEMTAKFLHVTSDDLPFLIAVDDGGGDERNGRVAGFAYANTFRAGTAYRLMESTIYLHPDFVGKGIGRPLYTRLIGAVRSSGKSSGLIAVITADNLPSINFHKSFGFESCGVLKRAGFKFGSWCDVTLWELLFPESKA